MTLEALHTVDTGHDTVTLHQHSMSHDNTTTRDTGAVAVPCPLASLRMLRQLRRTAAYTTPRSAEIGMPGLRVSLWVVNPACPRGAPAGVVSSRVRACTHAWPPDVPVPTTARSHVGHVPGARVTLPAALPLPLHMCSPHGHSACRRSWSAQRCQTLSLGRRTGTPLRFTLLMVGRHT